MTQKNRGHEFLGALIIFFIVAAAITPSSIHSTYERIFDGNQRDFSQQSLGVQIRLLADHFECSGDFSRVMLREYPRSGPFGKRDDTGHKSGMKDAPFHA